MRLVREFDFALKAKADALAMVTSLEGRVLDIDFDELLLHLDRGGSVFITNKQSEEKLLSVNMTYQSRPNPVCI